MGLKKQSFLTKVISCTMMLVMINALPSPVNAVTTNSTTKQGGSIQLVSSESLKDAFSSFFEVGTSVRTYEIIT